LATGSTYSEVSIGSASGPIVLSVWQAKAPVATVLFIPGTMLHPLSYEAFLANLAEKGFNVVGLHPVSHGKSPKKRGLTIQDIYSNAASALSYAKEAFGLPVFTHGTSQGGLICAVLAAKEEGVAGAFPHCVFFPTEPEVAEIVRIPNFFAKRYPALVRIVHIASRIAPWWPVPLGMYLKPARITTDLGFWASAMADPYRLGAYPLRFIDSLMNFDASCLCDGSLACPITVLYGEEDMLFTPEFILRAYERIWAPHKALLMIPGSHMALYTHPTEASDALAAAIRKTLSAFATAAE